MAQNAVGEAVMALVEAAGLDVTTTSEIHTVATEHVVRFVTADGDVVVPWRD